MKALFRSRPVQLTLAYIFALYLRITLATIRWQKIDQPSVEAVWKMDSGAILCFWHARISMSPASWPHGHGQDMRALISLSTDGEFIAKAMALLGFPAVRGSSQKRSDPAKAKGGQAAFRDMAKWIRQGGAMAITPDGPRGPALVMADGTPMLARLSGAPVMMVGLACKPCIRLGTWDTAVVPLPFAKGAMVWDGPLYADNKSDLVALASDWAARLSAVTDRAEQLVQ
jgi:lysophospholipid acyltransferase (LPLAT)-like uncharacterized protein